MNKKILSILIIALILTTLGIKAFAATASPTLKTPNATVTPSPATPKPSTSSGVTPSPSASQSQTPTPNTSVIQSPIISPQIPGVPREEPKGDLTDEAIKQSKAIMEYAETKEYFEDWKQNYAIDQVKEKSLFSFVGVNVDPVHPIVNILFFLQKNTVEVVVKFVSLAFTMDPTILLNGIVEKTVANSYKDNFLTFAEILIALIGFYIAYQTIKQNRNKVVSVIAKTIIVLVLAECFFHNSTDIMGEVMDRTNSISTIVASNVFNTDTPDGTMDEPVAMSANGILKEYVHRPWQMLEFGSTDEAKTVRIEGKTNEKVILSMNSGTRRSDKYTEIQEKGKFNTSSERRLGFMLFYMIPLLINLMIILSLSALVIGYKFYLLLFIFLGILIFPIALIPDMGMRILKEWAMKVIGIALTQIMIVFLLSVLLQINEVLLTSADQYGWLITMMLQSILYVFIFMKRKDIKKIFSRARMGIANPSKFNVFASSALRDIGPGSTTTGKPKRSIIRRAVSNTAKVPKKAYGGFKKGVHIAATGGDKVKNKVKTAMDVKDVLKNKGKSDVQKVKSVVNVMDKLLNGRNNGNYKQPKKRKRKKNKKSSTQNTNKSRTYRAWRRASGNTTCYRKAKTGAKTESRQRKVPNWRPGNRIGNFKSRTYWRGRR